MTKFTQMNKVIFQENLEKTVTEIKEKLNIVSDVDEFIIEPIDEPGKMLDGGDEMMKRMVLTPENIGGKQLKIRDVTKVLGGFFPRAPVWINVSFVKMTGTTAIFNLQTSLRFRKPTLLQNSDTGHPPFKALFNKCYP